MQPEQTEHLRKLIQDSPILTPGEKADWLDMLILMNDKQASELEQILKAQQPAADNAQAPLPSKIPPLTHISNLPADLAPSFPASRPLSTSRPAAPAPLPASAVHWQTQFKTAMTEKELTAPKAPASKAPVPKPAPAPPSTPRNGIVPNLRSRPATTPVAAGFAASASAPHRRSVPAPAALDTLTDAGKLNLANLRSMDPEDLLVRLQQLAKMEGYFNLLSHLEDSPLYKTYINTGKQALSQGPAFQQAGTLDTVIMTKEEFESFADILHKIQIN